jgi:hypothetical protein
MPQTTLPLISCATHDTTDNAFDSQSKIGWRNFLKGRISKKWGKLLTPKLKTDVIAAFKRAMITLLWKHSLQLWEFRNDESRKGEIRSVAEYKQHALDDKIREAYRQKDTLLHPITPCKRSCLTFK